MIICGRPGCSCLVVPPVFHALVPAKAGCGGSGFLRSCSFGSDGSNTRQRNVVKAHLNSLIHEADRGGFASLFLLFTLGNAHARSL